MIWYLDKSYNTWNGREWLQAIAYKDKDEELVLKLFKTLEQSYSQLDKRWKERDHMTKERYENWFKSYEIAYKKLQDETWLIYYHDWKKDIWEITIDWKKRNSLNEKFLIQKKVVLVCEKIDFLLKTNNLSKAKEVIDDVFNLIQKIRDKSITEDTFNYDHNYWYDKEWNMIQIDVWSFWEWKEYIKREVKEKKMLNNHTSDWLKKKSIELYNYHVRKCEKLYSLFS